MGVMVSGLMKSLEPEMKIILSIPDYCIFESLNRVKRGRIAREESLR